MARHRSTVKDFLATENRPVRPGCTFLIFPARLGSGYGIGECERFQWKRILMKNEDERKQDEDNPGFAAVARTPVMTYQATNNKRESSE